MHSIATVVVANTSVFKHSRYMRYMRLRMLTVSILTIQVG
jgi:hypothetical protein